MMPGLWILCALMAATVVQARLEKDYCKINVNHTMCKYKGVSPACGTEVLRGLMDGEVKFILNEHNRLRNKVASGAEPHGNPGPQPSASNMKLLKWDEELAEIAQRWADQCTEGHDEHRETSTYDTVGQNVLWKTSCRMPPTWYVALEEWYREVGWWNNSDVQSYRYVQYTEPYTQMAWAETRAMGCGFIKHYADSDCHQVFVCNYGPGGNREGYPVYNVGKPHSSCASSPVDPRYPALC